MGTRSTIALEFADGTVQSIYCHWDGYLEHNGQILLKHYQDPFEVRELIDLGNMSSLGAEIGEKQDFDTHTSASNTCLFYGRDRGENNVGAQKFDDFRDYCTNNCHEQYNYILRQIDGMPVWFVQHDGTKGRWITLTEAFDRIAVDQE